MKKYNNVMDINTENEFTLYVGTADEIKSLYKALYKKSKYYPYYSYNKDNFPKFNSYKIYGLDINNKREYSIVSQELTIEYLIDNNICVNDVVEKIFQLKRLEENKKWEVERIQHPTPERRPRHSRRPRQEQEVEKFSIQLQ